jgi:hypothetical protein
VSYLPVNKLAEWRKANEPSECPILKTKTNDWVVDHDHLSGEVRGVISRQANTLIGKMENIYTSMCKGDPNALPDVLENIAAYLRKEDSKILHPVGLNQLTSRFKNNLLKDDQCFLLHLLGASHSEIDSYNNISKRVKAFKKLLKEFYEQDNTTTNSGGAKSSKKSDKQIRGILLQIRGRYTRGS